MTIKETIFATTSSAHTDYDEIKISKATDSEKVCLTGRLNIHTKTTKGKEYFLLTINDNSGVVSSAIWNSSLVYPFIDNKYNNQKVQAYGTIKKNGSFLNIELDELNVLEEESDETLPTSETLQAELNKRIASISNPILKKIVINAIKDNKEEIIVAPFTEKTSYAYTCGLLHFTVDMCDMVSKVSESINCGFWSASTILNEDMLLAGAILANLGKCKTLRIDGTSLIEKTPIGILEEDSAISRDIAKKAIETTLNELLAKTEAFDKDNFDRISMELLHMVSSVKNNQSWGAISNPRSKNALILSNINNIIYTKGLFENLEKENDSNTFVKAYDNGKTYYIDEILE